VARDRHGVPFWSFERETEEGIAVGDGIGQVFNEDNPRSGSWPYITSWVAYSLMYGCR
jgi:hypothetical protein